MSIGAFAIVGLGISGLSVIRYLRNNGYKYVLFDDRDIINGLENEVINKPTFDNLKDFSTLIVSPGINTNIEPYVSLKCYGCNIINDVELFLTEISSFRDRSKVIAITGSNGKSTVTTLVAYLLEKVGLKVGLGGNIGVPVLDLIAQSIDYDVYVLELSSFQLENIKSLNADAATILNITEDHLDRYVDFNDYANVKSNIYRQAKNIIYNSLDYRTRNNFFVKANEFSFSSVDLSADYKLINNSNLYLNIVVEDIYISVNNFKLQGLHNYENILASLALIRSIYRNLYDDILFEELKNFTGLSHRFELVNNVNNIKWIDDSKATNVGATIAAIKSCIVNPDNKIHLLLGGDGKEQDFSLLRPYLNDNLLVYCFGRDGYKLSLLREDALLFDNMEQVMSSISQNLKSGDIVLLSPACASLDQFSSYAERGNLFTKLSKNYNSNI